MGKFYTERLHSARFPPGYDTLHTEIKEVHSWRVSRLLLTKQIQEHPSLSGVLTSLISTVALAFLFRLRYEEYVTLLPKSITTAIGMVMSEELGGLVTITVAVIVVTGIIGNVLAEGLCRLFHIREKVAVGLALGTSAHAVGTARAMEMGEIEGAMSSVAIVLSGIFTVLLANLFTLIY